jgi:hypothetical protein
MPRQRQKRRSSGDSNSFINQADLNTRAFQSTGIFFAPLLVNNLEQNPGNQLSVARTKDNRQ